MKAPSSLGLKQNILFMFVVLFAAVLASGAGPIPDKERMNADAGKMKGWSLEKDGYVPDEATAIAIAKAVWVPIYGLQVLDQEPFTAALKDGVWFVDGSLPKGLIGGTAHAEIEKRDGTILRVIHGK